MSCTVREVDTQRSSEYTIDPYRRDEESVSRLCHVHPEQGVDLECVLFRTGCTSSRVVQGLLPGIRPLWAAHLRAAFLVPGFETGKDVATGPPDPCCCLAALCKAGVPGRELSVELTSQSRPFRSCSARWPDKLQVGSQASSLGITSSVGLACGHRWRRCVRERHPARKEQERKPCDRCAVGGLLFRQPNSCECSREKSRLYLIRRDCG